MNLTSVNNKKHLQNIENEEISLKKNPFKLYNFSHYNQILQSTYLKVPKTNEYIEAKKKL